MPEFFPPALRHSCEVPRFSFFFPIVFFVLHADAPPCSYLSDYPSFHTKLIGDVSQPPCFLKKLPPQIPCSGAAFNCTYRKKWMELVKSSFWPRSPFLPCGCGRAGHFGVSSLTTRSPFPPPSISLFFPCLSFLFFCLAITQWDLPLTCPITTHVSGLFLFNFEDGFTQMAYFLIFTR